MVSNTCVCSPCVLTRGSFILENKAVVSPSCFCLPAGSFPATDHISSSCLWAGWGRLASLIHQVINCPFRWHELILRLCLSLLLNYCHSNWNSCTPPTSSCCSAAPQPKRLVFALPRSCTVAPSPSSESHLLTRETFNVVTSFWCSFKCYFRIPYLQMFKIIQPAKTFMEIIPFLCQICDIIENISALIAAG